MTRALRARLAAGVLQLLQRYVSTRRPPDFVIGDDYCRRWWVIPRNPFFNIYYHYFLHSDYDFALHDHPWWNMTLVLEGCYYEHLPARPKHPLLLRAKMTRLRRPGDFVFRRAKTPHRIQLPTPYRCCRTLFITGPVIRDWGFHCPQGWRHWKEFTAPDKPGQIGRGCG